MQPDADPDPDPSQRAGRFVSGEPASYRGRLAPSPTGLLHLGHVRTFAVAHARARAAGGALLLRIDDLDPERSREQFAAAAEQDLAWLGLGWEGTAWRQSRRTAAYRLAWEALVADGLVYSCRCSRRDLRHCAAAPHEIAGEAGRLIDEEPMYPGTCRPRWLPGSLEGAAERAGWLANGPGGQSWRFRVPAGQLSWIDAGVGPQCRVAGKDFGDFAVWRRDGVPAYQLAVVVDDAAMRITEVVRGADLLLSTARQLLLYQALSLQAPAWCHCPLVVDASGERLAKRADALSVQALRAQGLAPAQVLALAWAAAVL